MSTLKTFLKEHPRKFRVQQVKTIHNEMGERIRSKDRSKSRNKLGQYNSITHDFKDNIVRKSRIGSGLFNTN